MIKKSRLEIVLSKLKVFSKPSMELEQYPLDGKNASDILWAAFSLGNIEKKTIADLGCGTGILGIGALLLGAKKVYFLDKSQSAVQTAKENLQFVEKELNIELKSRSLFLVGDIKDFGTKVQITMQNPPFGTKTEHIDQLFLEKAMQISDVVYSIHKTSTLDFIEKFASKAGFEVTNKIRFEFPLKQTMSFHKQRIKMVDVSLLRLERKGLKT
jgi:putative methylase